MSLAKVLQYEILCQRREGSLRSTKTRQRSTRLMIQPPYANIALWIGIGFCIAQTGIFSGLNLAIFSVSRLRLEVEATGGNGEAAKLIFYSARSQVVDPKCGSAPRRGSWHYITQF